MIDARDQRDYQVSRVWNTLNIPFNTVTREDVFDIPKDRTIYILSESGEEDLSRKLADFIIDETGHQDVAVIDGGMEAYRKGGLIYYQDQDGFEALQKIKHEEKLEAERKQKEAEAAKNQA
eukprot:TRINITY_DN10120_c0_g1_i1.p2 TRINITY_DN10120_c0_g1~~TRINITY_DN10120_c0_g1_i1.p2  ORF type:complete len:121 (-),score=44.58 TRINITY_DN10120_c0_g1_i1:12-374(-)